MRGGGGGGVALRKEGHSLKETIETKDQRGI